MQGRGSRTEADRVLDANIGGDSLFEFFDLGTGGKPVGAQDVDDGLDVVFPNGLAAIRKERFANGNAAMSRECC